MASALAKSTKFMKRAESRKSHSWWWDSHMSPKNSKWLSENLEEMDQSVKRMLKLIEEDADSFAKKAEMYYQKRPELISHVEEFYRMYRSLAERYDHLTGELRKSMSSDLQSQSSGISDIGSEPTSTCPSPDQRLSRRRSGPRAAGFEVFLGSGGSSSDLCNKEGDESSTLDSESDSDDSSVNNYASVPNISNEQGLRRKITELEIELREVKEKLRTQQEQRSDGSSRGITYGGYDDLRVRIAEYEDEMRGAREKIRLSEAEIANLRIELQKYKYSNFNKNMEAECEPSKEDAKNLIPALEVLNKQAANLGESTDELGAGFSEPESKIQVLDGELRATKEKLQNSQREIENLRHELESSQTSIRCLQDQLGSAQEDSVTWKAKLNREQREVSKLLDRIARYKTNLSERDQEIRGLKEAINNANQTLSEENLKLQVDITKLSKERTYLEDNIKEWDLKCQSLEEEVRRIRAGKDEMEDLLQAAMEQLKATFKSEYDKQVAERDDLSSKITMLVGEISSRNDKIEHMDQHLKQLHMEQVKLIAGAQGASRQVEELTSRIKELETEIKQQRDVILEGAEEKREAIRQLCFSLEHYRTGYHQLRQAFLGHKQFPVMAS